MNATHVTISKDQLRASLEHWEREHRAGRTRSAAESAAMPLLQVVSESTDFMWADLIARNAAAPAGTMLLGKGA